MTIGEGKGDCNTTPADENPGLSGWSAIEDYLKRHDGSSMRLYSEDIDTLLVFAGLFSAVLTAFLAISFQLLQQDDSQIYVGLLSRISSQLESFQHVPSFLNSALSPLPSPSPPPFCPSTTARWINILWFLSLVFSLTSALFGILAKQWIREYLQWNSALAPARENVLVRQLRFEAWNDWKVSAGISAIPALLELSVVLFLVGLLVLLWTVDIVVATVITIVTAVLLAISCAVTLLPAVYHRCPYKSPTGWACVVIYDTFVWTLRCVWWNATRLLQNIRSCIGYTHPGCAAHPRFHLFQSWRQRDLSISELAPREVPKFTNVGVSRVDLVEGLVNIGRLTQDICEVSVLVRALAWVRKGSEDAQLLKHVAKSAESLHGDEVGYTERYYGFLYVIRHLCATRLGEFQPLHTFLSRFRRKAFKSIGGREAYVFRGGIRHSTSDRLDLPFDALLEDAYAWVLGYILLGDTLGFVTRFLRGIHEEKSVILVSLLKDFLVSPLDRAFAVECRVQLSKAYHEMASSMDHYASRTRGIHAMIFEVLCAISNVCMAPGTMLITSNGPRPQTVTQADDIVDVTIQTFDQNTNYLDEDACHRFVMMADFLIRSLNHCVVSHGREKYLLQKMLEVATLSAKRSYWNYGCYHGLPWISSILSCSDYVLKNLPSQELWLLLDTLESSCKKERLHRPLITDEAAYEDFATLKKRVGRLNPRHFQLTHLRVEN
ncbi:hypothetical protein PHLCEN_2v2114 [Hermanssonia centrifuga]|uniref:DUF6535 domain-containing protein n=1 Tax=Hermanssonia centrifuga TaxID=98765 RepID=A0A2R6RQ15_9APHY|nr:hypothetical protein PHLCEN_2v2114 [Hermanssonia centrifuga]